MFPKLRALYEVKDLFGCFPETKSRR